MAKHPTRRNFLRAAPLVAAVALPFSETFLFAAGTGLGEAPSGASEGFQLFTAEKLAGAIKGFQADPGEHYLYQPKAPPLTIAITTQGKTTTGDFEYHEGRDHVFLILDGATRFEVGGTPKNPRNTRPGEWLAPASEGATTLDVKKGDVLVIPRGSPHRQTTAESVVWMLISPSGAEKS